MFREFKVGELLDCSTTKGYNSNKGDLPNGKTPYVTRSAFNNGISGYFDDESGVFMNDGNCITIGAEGGVAFYQPDDFIAGIKVYTLRHERMSCEIGMYLCSALNTYSHLYSYTNARILDKIKAETIQLPVKSGTDEVNYTQEDIDWNYMESYIHDLEESYIHDLEESYIHDLDAYLKETGLDDYHLTDVEQVLLEREPVFGTFKVGELFDCSTTKGYNPNKGDLPNGDTPYVTRSAFNNGISGYFDDESGVFMNDGNCITIGAEGGVAFYQPDDFIAGIKVYTLRHKRMNCEIGMYLCSALNTYSHLYSYTNARILDKIKAETIQLPVKPGTDAVTYSQQDIDWDYMASYVRVMEKRVIIDVVDYKNEVIALTKDVCHK